MDYHVDGLTMWTSSCDYMSVAVDTFEAQAQRQPAAHPPPPSPQSTQEPQPVSKEIIIIYMNDEAKVEPEDWSQQNVQKTDNTKFVRPVIGRNTGKISINKRRRIIRTQHPLPNSLLDVSTAAEQYDEHGNDVNQVFNEGISTDVSYNLDETGGGEQIENEDSSDSQAMQTDCDADVSVLSDALQMAAIGPQKKPSKRSQFVPTLKKSPDKVINNVRKLRVEIPDDDDFDMDDFEMNDPPPKRKANNPRITVRKQPPTPGSSSNQDQNLVTNPH